jgi:hypothetical protein
MTQAPKEYIITEKQLDRVDRCYIEDCDGGCPNSYCPIDIAKEVRSRPHPAPTDEQCQICSQATERKAREQVLDEMGLNCWGEYQMNNRRCMICQVGERCYDKRQSLRAQQGGVSE